MRALPTLGPIPFRHGLGNSIEMLRAALGVLGAETDATNLLGLSGAAFRIYWRVSEEGADSIPVWDPDIPQICAIDASAAAAQAFGWRLLRYRNMPDHVAFQFVAQSIGRGQPLLSYGFVGEPEEVIVVGCERTQEGRSLLVRTRHTADPIRVELADGPWPGTDNRGTCVALFDRIPPRGRIPFEVELQRALRRAVWLARAPLLHPRAAYHAGLDAYDAWIDALLRPGEALGARATADRLGLRYGISLPADPAARERIGMRHVLHRALTDLAFARCGAADFVRRHESILDAGDAAAWLGREAAALGEGASLWPTVVSGEPPRFRLETAPEGFELDLRRDETARCLRIAAAAHARSIEAIDRNVPPTKQELAGDDEEVG